ncbi:hypothetical protein GMDG_08693, partial [Pseudogymnoascus destructans 20631-21]
MGQPEDYYTHYNDDDENELGDFPDSQSNAKGPTMPIMEPGSSYTCTEDAFQGDYNDAIVREDDYSENSSVESEHNPKVHFASDDVIDLAALNPQSTPLSDFTM